MAWERVSPRCHPGSSSDALLALTWLREGFPLRPPRRIRHSYPEAVALFASPKEDIPNGYCFYSSDKTILDSKKKKGRSASLNDIGRDDEFREIRIGNNRAFAQERRKDASHRERGYKGIRIGIRSFEFFFVSGERKAKRGTAEFICIVIQAPF